MKSATFYKLLLGLPYLLIIPGFIATRDFFSRLANEIPDPPSSSFLRELLIFWGITGIFWIIPYTLFAVFLLIWSFGKSQEMIRIWYARSPFLLMILSPFFFMVIIFASKLFSDKNVVGKLAGYGVIGVVCSAPLSLLYGFFFVGIGLVLHAIFFSTGLIKDETSTS